MPDVAERVKEILLEILDIKAEDIVLTARLLEDLHATSIDFVEILTALQNTFRVEIDEAGAAKVETVQDTIDLLREGIARKEASLRNPPPPKA